MTPQEELDKRRRQLAARDGVGGYEKNCAALRKRIAELEAEIDAGS